MTILWRGLCILPLLFVSGNCQFLFPLLNHFDKPARTDSLNVGDSGNIESVEIADGSTDNKKKKGNANVNVETKYKGKWELFTQNAGVSAMHLILLPKIDQALMFDATVWKQSKLKLPGPPCRIVEETNEQDCFCHSVLLDIETAKIRPLRVRFSSYFAFQFFHKFMVPLIKMVGRRGEFFQWFTTIMFFNIFCNS